LPGEGRSEPRTADGCLAAPGESKMQIVNKKILHFLHMPFIIAFNKVLDQ
jgi:hypothetical protein